MNDVYVTISISGFEPKTAKGKETTFRKLKLRDEFLAQNSVEEIKHIFFGEKVSVDVCFYLYEDPRDSSRYNKDMDNLLKIVFDVLSEHMDNDKKNPGLGLIEADKDYLIYELHSTKKLVKLEPQEGIDITIKKFIATTKD